MAIVGAGLTGLWTAHYLAEADPSLRIVVVEAEVAGFGASGRNGGWCSALFPLGTPWPGCPRPTPRGAVRRDAVLGRRGAPRGGRRGHRRPRGQGRHHRAGPQPGAVDPRPAESGRPAAVRGRGAQRLRATGTLGATYTPDCAALHPGRLVRGLADAVERRGVRIVERTPATAISPGLVRTARGVVRAPYVVRATEGFTPRLPSSRRDVVPVYSLIIASEPLPASTWDEIGLAQRETFSDHRHLVIYGQRTADDRLVFGGRGAPYHFGSRIRPVLRPRPPGLRAAARDPARPVPGAARRPVHPRVGRPARHPPRLVRVGRSRPRHRPRVGRWVRRRRGLDHQPGRANPARPAARAARPTSPRCPGSTTAPGPGSRSRCAGWASTPGCAR